MYDDCKKLARTLWVVCVPFSLLTGIVLFGWLSYMLTVVSFGRFQLIYGSVIVSSFVFSVFHGVAAAFIKRGSLWAAQASIVLSSVWILIGLAIFVAALLVPNPFCLFGLIISIGGVTAIRRAFDAIAEINADYGWNRDGPLGDSKGFAFVVRDAAAHPNPFPEGEGTRDHPTISERPK